MKCFLSLALAVSFFTTIDVYSNDKKLEQKPTPNSLSLQLNVEKYQLPNGLTVVLHQEPSVPLVSYQTWFKVGSKDEEPGYTGIAHLFEHMMFKGAKRYSNSDFDKVLRGTGANYNAFTSQDYTGYYIDLPSDKLELAIDLESDRLEFLQLSDEHLASEREVVKEERRYRLDNSIMGTMYAETFGAFFSESSYKWPVIGYMEDLNKINLQKCQEFFKRFYSPNNAVVVVAGDFDPNKTKKLIEKYYGHMKPSEIIRPPQKAELPLSKPREKIIEKDIQTEVFSLSYHIPPQGSDEGYAFDLLSNILSEGTSSRLYNKVVRESKLADSISAMNYSLMHHGLFMFVGNMKNNSTPADRKKVLDIIEGEVWRVKNQTVSNEELEKAKTYVMKSYVDGLKTINGRGHLLAQAEVYYGDYTRVFSDLEKYNQVTAEQIRDVSKKYLNKNQSSLVVVTKPHGAKKTAAMNTQPARTF
jgi:zinc protease